MINPPFDDIRDGRGLARLNAKLIGVIAAGGLLFGASLGCYVGGVQIPLAAVKVPTALLSTLLICFALMHVINVVRHPQLRAAQSLALTLVPLAVMATALAAAAPVMGLMTSTLEFDSYPSYLFLILFGVLWGLLGGAAGVWVLHRGMRRVVGPCGPTVALWVLAYQFVGGQCNWMLRPWIGDSREVEGLFSLTRNLRGNFYVAVWDAFTTFWDRVI